MITAELKNRRRHKAFLRKVAKRQAHIMGYTDAATRTLLTESHITVHPKKGLHLTKY